MTDKEKLEKIKRLIAKSKKDIRKLNQTEMGVIVKLSYGASLKDITDKEFKKLA